jgi:hypothetical protein
MKTSARTESSRLGRALQTVAAAGVWAFLPFPAAHAQVADTVVVPPEPACIDCRLDLELRTTLGDDVGPGFVGLTTIVSAGNRFYYVANMEALEEVRVFDHSGRFLRLVGREGAGPGEFRMIWDLRVSHGDTLHVIDISNLRRSVFSPSLELVRTNRLPGRLVSNGFIPLPGGEFFINVPLPDSERTVRLLHRLDGDGRILASFAEAPTDGTSLSGNLQIRDRKLALSGDGQLISAVGLDQIEIWTPEGEKVKVFSLAERGWAENAPQAVAGYGPTITFLHVDELNRLWILVRVGDPNWEGAVADDPRHRLGNRGSSKVITDYDGYWDSIVEVVDLRRGHVLVRERFPGTCQRG